MGANPHANGGILLRDLRMPDFHAHAVDVPSPGAVEAPNTLVLGKFLRDVVELNHDQHNFRILAPMKHSRISWEQSLRSPIVSGTPRQLKPTNFWHPQEA